jgi:dTDP-4-dehydrorhamnose reductase
MTVFIFGASGMLGGYLVKQFPTAIGFTSKDYDITKKNLNLFLKLSMGDVVINAAGVIPQSGNTDYFPANADFPHELQRLCASSGAHLIHISTDCVFSGSKGGYKDTDIPDATNDYGTSKAKGEPPGATVIRTSIIGEEKKGKKSLLEWVKSQDGKTIKGFTTHMWNGVTCWQLSKVIKQIIEQNNFWKGVKHVCSPVPVSKFELVRIIIKVYKLNIVLEPEVGPIVDKTLISSGFTIPSIEDQIMEMATVHLD